MRQRKNRVWQWFGTNHENNRSHLLKSQRGRKITNLPHRSAAIIGAGIGGLATAIALAQTGWHVRVFERRPALEAVGAGIQMSPNACKVLKSLGVLDTLLPTTFAPQAIEMRMGLSGRQVFSLPLKDVAKTRWGGPYVHVHRGDLLTCLLDRAQAMAEITIVVNANATQVHQNPNPTVQFADGSKVTSDLVVVADGMNSTLASQVVPASAPQFSGCIAWRTTIPMDQLNNAPPPTACAWVGPGKHAVTTRIRGGTMANFVGIVETKERAPESWRHTGDRAQALADFAGWDACLVEILTKAPDLFCWSLMERAPLVKWGQGAVTLLGDAAHPMLPSMAQGAAAALEDGVALAACLVGADVPKAIAKFQRYRQPRAARVQAMSAANLKLFHRRSWITQLGTYGPAALAAAINPNLLHRRQDWVYGHDPLGV